MDEIITEKILLGDINAELADQTAKRLNIKPSEVQFVRKGLVIEAKGTDEDERSSKELIMTENKDRDNEMLLTKGAVLEHYQSNPLVLWAHKYDQPPVGRNAWIKRDSKSHGLLAKTIYAATTFAEEIWQLVKGGFLPGRSIGFIPLEAHQPSTDEMKEHPERKDTRLVYDKWELLEYSIVPVPSNRQALVQAVGKDFNLSPELSKELGLDSSQPEPLPVPVKPERTVSPVHIIQPVTRRIVQPVRIPKVIVRVNGQRIRDNIKQLVQDEINRKRGRV